MSTATLSRQDVWDIVATVTDPEIPVLTIEDIGILRDVTVDDGVVVTITPTYSGCPAMDAIRDDVTAALVAGGIGGAEIRMVHAPAWTTDWMTDDGKRKLEAYGIAPPAETTAPPAPVLCPRCRSAETDVVSEFGSTACKALLVCTSCGEPFDLFKTI